MPVKRVRTVRQLPMSTSTGSLNPAGDGRGTRKPRPDAQVPAPLVVKHLPPSFRPAGRQCVAEANSSALAFQVAPARSPAACGLAGRSVLGSAPEPSHQKALEAVSRRAFGVAVPKSR